MAIIKRSLRDLSKIITARARQLLKVASQPSEIISPRAWQLLKLSTKASEKNWRESAAIIERSLRDLSKKIGTRARQIFGDIAKW